MCTLLHRCTRPPPRPRRPRSRIRSESKVARPLQFCHGMSTQSRLSRAELQRLSRIDVGRTPLRAVAELTVIAGLVALVEGSRLYGLYPLVLLLIATRQHALLVLMHDAAHFRATRSRWLNTLFGELIGWPFLMSMRGYRRHHQCHHVERNLNTKADPDFARLERDGWQFPMSRAWLLSSLTRDLVLLNTGELLREARDAKNNVIESAEDVRWVVARLVFLAGMAAALFAFGGWRLYAMYWLLPSLTVLKAILRIRAIADHFGLDGNQQPTRTILAPWWERLLIAPCNIGLHHVHHAHSSIPYYRLREAHAQLWSMPAYQAQVQVSKSYLHALLVECCPRLSPEVSS